jgi:hypothetical protein
MPPAVRVTQYMYAADTCSATWCLLLRFLARYLWRA